jgi:hypothetical protein
LTDLDRGVSLAQGKLDFCRHVDLSLSGLADEGKHWKYPLLDIAAAVRTLDNGDEQKAARRKLSCPTAPAASFFVSGYADRGPIVAPSRLALALGLSTGCSFPFDAVRASAVATRVVAVGHTRLCPGHSAHVV